MKKVFADYIQEIKNELLTLKKEVYCYQLKDVGCCGSCHGEIEDDYADFHDEEFSDFKLFRCCSAKVNAGSYKDLVFEDWYYKDKLKELKANFEELYNEIKEKL